MKESLLGDVCAEFKNGRGKLERAPLVWNLGRIFKYRTQLKVLAWNMQITYRKHAFSNTAIKLPEKELSFHANSRRDLSLVLASMFCILCIQSLCSEPTLLTLNSTIPERNRHKQRKRCIDYAWLPSVMRPSSKVIYTHCPHSLLKTFPKYGLILNSWNIIHSL